MNRRDFLRAQTPELVTDFEVTLLRFARAAMATVFELLLPWGTPNADSAAADVFDRIDRLESQLTVFRETSEVSRLNRMAAAAPVPVESRLFDLLCLAGRIQEDTAGAFDITSGPIIKAWGFFRRQGRVPSNTELRAAMDRVGMPHVALDRGRRSVRFNRLGMEINLGSIGKGYALDRAGEHLKQRHGIASGLLSGGHSSVLALGCPPDDARGWAVGLRDPLDPERRLAIVRLRGRAMAASASTYQHFVYNDRKFGHLLDPRRGRPAEGVLMATAIAPTAAEADALATAFYVLGPEGTWRYCESHPQAAAVVMRDEPGAELEFINLPPGDLIPAAADITTNESLWESA
jgi:FAD:protein FMN transferase